jgi:hypothetical protein
MRVVVVVVGVVVGGNVVFAVTHAVPSAMPGCLPALAACAFLSCCNSFAQHNDPPPFPVRSLSALWLPLFPLMVVMAVAAAGLLLRPSPGIQK